MSLNSTPSSERIHIGFFGNRNAGKSSLVNAVTGQEISLVSDVLGTTTDPVLKSMELLPLGPVVIIDTAGLDDEGDLGEKRVKKTKQILNRCDAAVLVAQRELSENDKALIKTFEEKNIPYIIAYNKSDIFGKKECGDNEICTSAVTGDGIFELKEKLSKIIKTEDARKIVSDLVRKGDFVILVTPIDESAPKGRIILPQQQTIRDILDANAINIVVQPTELLNALVKLNQRPRLVICDSQVFSEVSKIVPEQIPLTSFSILMARYKGYLDDAKEAVSKIRSLNDGDTVLIAEGCTHHRQCNDIGTVKIPNWLKTYTNKNINIETVSGIEFPEDLSKYSLIIHCGGCMLNSREMKYRVKCAKDAGVPITNYGVIIAEMMGILERSLKSLNLLK